jgi:cytochrome c-type biogenesis protein CcmH/NrfG
LEPGIKAQIVPMSLLPVVAALAVVAGLGTMYAVNWNAYQANLTLLSAVSPQTSLQTNLDDFEKAISYGSFGTQEAREQLVQGALSLAGNSQVPAATQKALFDAAAKEMNLQVAASPLDARFPFFLGALYGAYGDTADAQTYLQQALKLSPDKQSIRFQLAINMLSQGQNDQALALLKETYELDTDDTDALVFYAMAAIRDNQDALADQLVAKLTALGLSGDQRIIGSYVARKQYGKIAEIWAAYLTAHPGNTQAEFGLAAAYFANGEIAKATAQLQSIADTNPDANAKAQALDLIKQIKAGTLKLQ